MKNASKMKCALGSLLLVAATIASAEDVEEPLLNASYLAPMLHYIKADSASGLDDGVGGSVAFGKV